MSIKKVILSVVCLIYFYIDMMVGYAYWLTIMKVNEVIGTYTYHYAAPAPFINIIMYRGQIALFKTIPEFTMALFYQALRESVVCMLLFFGVALVVFYVIPEKEIK